MKLIAFSCMLMFACIPAFVLGQTFSFYPGDEYTATLEMDVYSDHQIDVYHDGQDSAYISWRLIEQDYPDEWDVQLCDWQHCYTYLPLNGDMLPVAPGNSGYIRLLVNPFQTPGNAHFMLWIFPTGAMEEHVEIHFYFNTIIADVSADPLPKTSCFYQQSTQSIQMLNAPKGLARLYCITGSRMDNFLITGSLYSHHASAYAKGIYLIVFENGEYHRIFIQ